MKFPLLISFISAAPVYSNGMNPGMALRLEQRTVDAWKATMADFLPHYINADLQLPKEKELVISGLFDLIHYDIKWTDITYDVATIDVKDIQFNFQAASAIERAARAQAMAALDEAQRGAQAAYDEAVRRLREAKEAAAAKRQETAVQEEGERVEGQRLAEALGLEQGLLREAESHCAHVAALQARAQSVRDAKQAEWQRFQDKVGSGG